MPGYVLGVGARPEWSLPLVSLWLSSKGESGHWEERISPV